MELMPDIVIATIPQHIESFKKLAGEVGAKFVYQIGNEWSVEASMTPNVMASARIRNVPKNINFVEYHQEFPLNIFKPSNNLPENNIYSFVNCFNTASIYEVDWHLFLEIESMMSGWRFRSFGGSCRDGAADGQNEVARMMGESKFIWHTKYGGDGYGHIIYNSAAVARPLIVKKQYYIGKMGEELMEDGKTCLAIDGLSSTEIMRKIEYWSDGERYKQLCEDIYDNFQTKVNFNREENDLKKFIDKLI
jgi:hypothetical protein